MDFEDLLNKSGYGASLVKVAAIVIMVQVRPLCEKYFRRVFRLIKLTICTLLKKYSYKFSKKNNSHTPPISKKISNQKETKTKTTLENQNKHQTSEKTQKNKQFNKTIKTSHENEFETSKNIVNKVASNSNKNNEIITNNQGIKKKSKVCTRCNKSFELSKEFWGHTPAGNYRNICRICMRKNIADHAKKNPHFAKTRQQQRIKRLQEAPYQKDYNDIELKNSLLKHQNGSCYYCKTLFSKEYQPEKEHKTPISKGGSDIKSNIVLACYACNKEKANKTVAEYKDWLKKNNESILFD